jgi:hypothetical protein
MGVVWLGAEGKAGSRVTVVSLPGIQWHIDGTVMASVALVAVACSAPAR